MENKIEIKKTHCGFCSCRCGVEVWVTSGKIVKVRGDKESGTKGFLCRRPRLAAVDFHDDQSGKILLAHKAGALTDSEKEIGSNATFGMQDTLIPAQQDYLMRAAHDYLCAYFPGLPEWDIRLLLNCPVRNLNVGLILFKKAVSYLPIFFTR